MIVNQTSQFLGVSEEIFNTVEGASFAIASAPTGELGADFLEVAQSHAQLQLAMAGYRQAISSKDRDAVRKAQRDMGEAIRNGGQQGWSDIVERLKGSGWATRPGFLNTPSFHDHHQRTTRHLQATLAQPFLDAFTTIQPYLDKIVRVQEEAAALAYGTDYQAAEKIFIPNYPDYETVLNRLTKIRIENTTREVVESGLFLFDHIATIFDRGAAIWRSLGRVDPTITLFCAQIDTMRIMTLSSLGRFEEAGRAEEIVAQYYTIAARALSKENPQNAIQCYEEAYAFYKECVNWFLGKGDANEAARVGLLAVDTIEEAIVLCQKLKDFNNFTNYRKDQIKLVQQLFKKPNIEILKKIVKAWDHDILFYSQLDEPESVIQVRLVKVSQLAELIELLLDEEQWSQARTYFKEFVAESGAVAHHRMLQGEFSDPWEGLQLTFQTYDWMADKFLKKGRIQEALRVLIEFILNLEGILLHELPQQTQLERQFISKLKELIDRAYQQAADLLREMGKWQTVVDVMKTVQINFVRINGQPMHPLEAFLKHYSLIVASLTAKDSLKLLDALADPEMDLLEMAGIFEQDLQRGIAPIPRIEGDTFIITDLHGRVTRVPISPGTKAKLEEALAKTAAKRKEKREGN